MATESKSKPAKAKRNVYNLLDEETLKIEAQTEKTIWIKIP